MRALSPIAYWPLADPSGTVATDASGNGRNGTYSGVTLGVPGIGDGRTAASFNGSTSYVDVFGADLASAFGGAEGTAAAWVRIASGGVWSDGVTRQIFILLADANNYMQLTKASTANNLFCEYKAGGTAKSVLSVVGPTANWFHVAMTWSRSADQMKTFVNGAQVGATQTGLGLFAGTITRAIIGATTTGPAQVWSGDIAHPAVFASALSASQIASLAVVS